MVTWTVSCRKCRCANRFNRRLLRLSKMNTHVETCRGWLETCLCFYTKWFGYRTALIASITLHDILADQRKYRPIGRRYDTTYVKMSVHSNACFIHPNPCRSLKLTKGSNERNGLSTTLKCNYWATRLYIECLKQFNFTALKNPLTTDLSTDCISILHSHIISILHSHIPRARIKQTIHRFYLIILL